MDKLLSAILAGMSSVVGFQIIGVKVTFKTVNTAVSYLNNSLCLSKNDIENFMQQKHSNTIMTINYVQIFLWLPSSSSVTSDLHFFKFGRREISLDVIPERDLDDQTSRILRDVVFHCETWYNLQDPGTLELE